MRRKRIDPGSKGKWHRVPLAMPAALVLALASQAEAQTPQTTDGVQESPPVPGLADADQEQADEARVLEGRRLFQEGLELSAQERWAEALESFRRSGALVSRPSTLFNMAAVLYRLGRSREGLDVMDEYLESAEGEGEQLDAARELRRQLRTSCSTLVLTVAPADAHVWVDGDRIPGDGARREILLDSGSRSVTIERPGYVRHRFQVSTLPGEASRRTVTLRAEALARPTERASSTLPWITIGSGAAMVGGGVVLLLLARKDISTVEDAVPGTSWEAVENANGRAPVLSGVGVGLSVLGVAAALGGTWWLLSTGSTGETQGEVRAELRLGVTPWGATVRGSL